MGKKLKLNWSGMGRDLMLSFLGTTLSIILTFGTSAIYEHHKQKEAQRLVTMMIVHDMDVTIEQFQNMLETESKYYAAAQYVMAHKDEIGDISMDTIWDAITYLLEGQGYTYDDSKEKIFNSGYDSWSNIDNALFVDLVQAFYNTRRTFKNDMEIDEKKPISREELRKFVVERAADKELPQSELQALLKSKFELSEVIYYINHGPRRKRNYEAVIAQLKNYSDRCKFLMGISDEEIKDYVQRINSSGRKLSPRQLPGKWLIVMSGVKSILSEFRADGTMFYVDTTKVENPFYSGAVKSIWILHGTWSLNNDTLVLHMPRASDEFILDSTGIRYPAKFSDSVRNYYDKYNSAMQQYLEENKSDTSHFDLKYVVRLDRTGTKLEMNYQGDGQTSTGSTFYAVRQ